MRIALDGLSDAEATAVVASIADALARSRSFRRPVKWPYAVVIVGAGKPRITSRPDFASWLTANGLPELAHECMSRKARFGEVLVFLDADAPTEAVTRFVIVNLATEAQRLTSNA